MGDAGARGTQAAGSLPMISSSQNPSLSPGRPIHSQTHLYKHGSDCNSDPDPEEEVLLGRTFTKLLGVSALTSVLPMNIQD